MLEIILRLNTKFQDRNYKIVKLLWNDVRGEGVVLVDRNEDFEPYVVWSIDKEGETHWGDYYAILTTAVRGFRNRAKGLI